MMQIFSDLRALFGEFPLQVLNISITLRDSGFPGFDGLAGVDANIQEGQWRSRKRGV
jgi:hypothetical protein